MGELQSALDALAGEDLDGMVASQFLDRTSMLVRARNRIDAELARTAAPSWRRPPNTTA